MSPREIGRSYDTLTRQWENPEYSLDGIPQLQRALRFVKLRQHALDVGCGCNGRFIDCLQSQGFQVEGLDVSERMVALARKRDPDIQFHHDDICRWELPRRYDLIVGWDSIWHVPIQQQEPVLKKLCAGLLPEGVLLFTMGGLDRPGEVRDSNMGPPMYTATLGIPQALLLLTQFHCVCRHLEYDQHPESHVFVVAQKA